MGLHPVPPGLARVFGALEKELLKNAKLKRLRNKILATDEWKYLNSPKGNA
jgi:hypothetical protein